MAALNNFLVFHYFTLDKMEVALGEAHLDANNLAEEVDHNYCSYSKDLAVVGSYWLEFIMVGYYNMDLVTSFVARNMMGIIDTF